jgi:hypothetical protein
VVVGQENSDGIPSTLSWLLRGGQWGRFLTSGPCASFSL